MCEFWPCLGTRSHKARTHRTPWTTTQCARSTFEWAKCIHSREQPRFLQGPMLPGRRFIGRFSQATAHVSGQASIHSSLLLPPLFILSRKPVLTFTSSCATVNSSFCGRACSTFYGKSATALTYHPARRSRRRFVRTNPVDVHVRVIKLSIVRWEQAWIDCLVKYNVHWCERKENFTWDVSRFPRQVRLLAVNTESELVLRPLDSKHFWNMRSTTKHDSESAQKGRVPGLRSRTWSTRLRCALPRCRKCLTPPTNVVNLSVVGESSPTSRSAVASIHCILHGWVFGFFVFVRWIGSENRRERLVNSLGIIS